MINNLIVWAIGLIVFWFALKPIMEQLSRAKASYLKNNLQLDESLLGEFDTVYLPKLTTNPLYTVRYLGKKYKVAVLLTDRRIVFRVYSVFMTWNRNLLMNPISQGFDILYKNQELKKYMSPENIKGYFDPNIIYPEFLYKNIMNDDKSFILSADNSELGKLEIRLFDEKVINEIKKVLNK